MMRKLLVPFVVCTVVLLALATPVFYWLTKEYYAEDMIELVEAVRAKRPIPAEDLEADVMKGIMIQFCLFIVVLSGAIVLTLRLIRSNLEAYRLQKEFTENASHELQTPLAVFRSKLDLLLQQSDNITESQAAIIQDLYEMTGRLSRLNRNLLLLAKMENKQFSKKEEVDVAEVIRQLLPYLESLAGNLTIKTIFELEEKERLCIPANRSLLESLLNNLVVNAVRHNKPDGEIRIILSTDSLTVSNTSTEKALNAKLIFNRFYRPSEKTKGNGLGLAIVKAVCDYHGWKITYHFDEATSLHHFKVRFS